MERSRVLVANWFNYPQYYDIAYQAHTRREADFIEAACRKYSFWRHLPPGLASVAIGHRPRGRRALDAVARRDKSDCNAAHAAHRSPPPAREPSGLPACAPRVEGTSPAARISAPHIYGKAISTAAQFGSVAGTVQHLRFPVRH